MVRELFGRNSAKFCAIALIAAGALSAQQTAPLAFEVATIKPAPPFNPAQIAAGKLHMGMKIEAGRVDIGFLSIADLIRTAYEVKPYQVSGPDWINTERFDILAKIPEGGTKEQVPAMLKTLLQERFKLSVHKESKDHSVYALVVGKGGSKLKESPAEEPAPEAGAAPSGKGGAVIETNNGSMRVHQSADGRGATITGSEAGTMKMGMGPDGTMHMEASKVSMPRFAEMISRFVDKPVVDDTGLKGNYQIALDLSMADLMRVAQKAGVPIPAAGPGGGGGAAAGVADAASDPGGGGTVFTAVQALGLKLEPRKEAADTYVVDHVEKTPSEN